VSRWIDIPSPPVVHSRPYPLLVETRRRDELLQHYRGAHHVDLDVGGADHTSRVVEAMKAALEFPDWCASSWDSIDDAYEELGELWPFPLLMIFRGFDRLLEAHQHLALETTIQVHELRRAFSQDEKQLIVVFEGERWT
jgi:hypothetical protein